MVNGLLPIMVNNFLKTGVGVGPPLDFKVVGIILPNVITRVEFSIILDKILDKLIILDKINQLMITL